MMVVTLTIKDRRTPTQTNNCGDGHFHAAAVAAAAATTDDGYCWNIGDV